MTQSHLLSLVAIAGTWSWITIVRARGDRALALKVLAMHGLGFPLLLLVRAFLGDMTGFEIMMYAGVEALFVTAVLSLVYIVKWEA